MIYEGRFLNNRGNKVIIADFDGSGDIGVLVTTKDKHGTDNQIIFFNTYENGEIGKSSYPNNPEEMIRFIINNTKSIDVIIDKLKQVRQALEERELGGQTID